MFIMTDIGAYGAMQQLLNDTSVQGTTAANSASVNIRTVDGSSRRRRGRSLVIQGYSRADSGTPTTGSGVITVEHSADDSTWATLPDITGSSSGLAVAHDAADNFTTAQAVYNLEGANEYIRITVTPTYNASNGKFISVSGFLYYNAV